ncbi:hypothetical protein FJ364_03385 [Candidatus Dependentiae bacterium]|nr:hypothetical protein [Candidatus Dependentiae bacterium]
MHDNKFTNGFAQLLQEAVDTAQAQKNPTVSIVHFLNNLAQHTLFKSALSKTKVSLSILSDLIKNELQRIPASNNPSQVIPDQSFQEFLRICQDESKKLTDEFISIDVGIFALTKLQQLPTSIKKLLEAGNFTYATIQSWLTELRKGTL